MGGRLTDLGAEVSASLDRARVANGAAERVRARLAAGEPPRARASRIRWEVLAGAVAAAAAVVLGIALGRQPAPRTEALTFHVAQAERGVVGAFLAAPAEREMPLAFSDGTNIRLAPLAKARVSEVGPNGARVLLESGVVHAEVVHRPDAHWSVDAGPFEVRVTGTKFDVAWDPSEASIVVELREGSVVVTGCTLGEGRRVVAGEKLHVSCMHSAAVSAAPPTLTPQALPDATATATATATPTPTATARRVDAVADADDSSFTSACDTLPAADLLSLADASRYARNFARAEQALRATRRRFPGTDAAAAAAFGLGRIAFDARRDFAAAGDAFDVYLHERPNGPLAREALGRALEARTNAGDTARAQALAARYLADFPDGPHAQLARRVGGAR